MPWDCRKCGAAALGDDVGACSACGAGKASWTVVADRTRTFAVTARRSAWRLLRGEGDAPLEAGAAYDPARTAPAEEVVAVPAGDARALAAAGRRPAPAHVLFVRLPPSKDARPVVLTPEHEARATEEASFPGPASEGELDVAFLFVRGDPTGVDLPGVHVVDLAEPTPAGVAPRVGFQVGGKKRAVLPVRAPAAALRLVLAQRSASGERTERVVAPRWCSGVADAAATGGGPAEVGGLSLRQARPDGVVVERAFSIRSREGGR